jgi:hypothetical protein
LLLTKHKVIVEGMQIDYKYGKKPSLIWLVLIWIEIWKMFTVEYIL